MKPVESKKKRYYTVLFVVAIGVVIGMLAVVLWRYPIRSGNQSNFDSTYGFPTKQNPAVAPVPAAQ